MAKGKKYYDHLKAAEDYGTGVNMQKLEEELRPREKALSNPESVKILSPSELIAIILRTGTQNANALELSAELLREHDNSLLRLYRSLLGDTAYSLKGIGQIKRITILAALELGLRLREEIDTPDDEAPLVFNRSDRAYRFMRQRLLGESEEQMWVLILNTQCTLIKPFLIAKGGISETTADIRTILRHVIRFSGAGFILMHNHPGGSLRPSKGDDELTELLRDASKTVMVTFLDHIIFTDKGYYSYRDSSPIL